ncbi:Protein of unknown function [Gryllus bimaculatus]|nr:Protein of unknown function [Gryllus bimaculatus]
MRDVGNSGAIGRNGRNLKFRLYHRTCLAVASALNRRARAESECRARYSGSSAQHGVHWSVDLCQCLLKFFEDEQQRRSRRRVVCLEINL